MTRTGLVLVLLGVAAIGLAAATFGGGAPAIPILIGAIGLNLVIVGSWFLIRPLAERLRRHLPPWLGW